MNSYRMGVGLALVTSLLTVWSTIVRDDGNGAAFFMLIMAAFVGFFAARFQPGGMARTMAGVAIMQLLLGLLIATASVTASLPGGPSRALSFSAGFALLWLTAAAFFRSAASAARS